MRLTDERPQANTIRSYGPGEIRIDDTRLTRSCIVASDALITDWEPQSVEELQPEHLERALELKPEIVLLGSGSRQKFPDPAIWAALMSRKIGFEVMDTGAACRTYNVLVSENRRVVAALFVS